MCLLHWALVVAVFLYGCLGVRVTIEPAHVRLTVSNANRTATVMCRADRPLTLCQFSLWDNQEGPVLTLSSEAVSMRQVSFQWSRQLVSYSYRGRGLQAGDCGVRLQLKDVTNLLIGCRVGSSDRGWVYKWMSFHADAGDNYVSNISASLTEVVAIKGGSASLHVKVGRSLDRCRFKTSSDSYLNFDEGDESLDSFDRYLYQGAGLESGDCGLTLRNVTVRDNGLFIASFGRGLASDYRHVVIIVAEPPSSPEVTVNFRGDVMEATCLVRRSRPSPNITWALGGDVIRLGSEDDSPPREDDVWRWPWMTGSTFQVLKRRLQSEDTGKLVGWSVAHTALTEPLMATVTVGTFRAQGRCQPLQSSSVNISCRDMEMGVDVNCLDPLPAGTIAHLRCKPGLIREHHKPSPTTVTCREDATWDQDLFRCVEASCKALTAASTAELSCSSNGTAVSCTEPVPVGTTARARCRSGLVPGPPTSFPTLTCRKNGRWSHKTDRFVCVQNPNLCSPLSSDSVRITCFFGLEATSCSQLLRPGTVAELECRPGFTTFNVFIRRTSCSTDGNWTHSISPCVPDCGKRKSNSGEVLVSGGDNVQVGEFPWHVGLYKKNKSNYIHECGGSLISSKVVLTAAHCLWEETMSQQRNFSNLIVAAGALAREWNDTDPQLQAREVQSVDTNFYSGRVTNFAHDIAVLVLKGAVEINDVVNIVCMDWRNQMSLQPEAKGLVAGWGITEDGYQSSRLKYIELPYVPTNTCLEALSTSSKILLSPDKFCAGHRDKSMSVCRGDSGGGLVFPDPSTSRYYLTGIVSNNFKDDMSSRTGCFNKQYTGFTKVATYISWIQNFVMKNV